jgi:hypothetical protein
MNRRSCPVVAAALVLSALGGGFGAVVPEVGRATLVGAVPPLLTPAGFAVTPADTVPWIGRLLADVDFGPYGQTDGTTILWSAGAREARMGWTGGRVHDFVDARRRQPRLRDGVEGVDARFSIGVSEPDSLYRLTLWLADTLRIAGPVAIDVGPVRVAESLAPEAGTRRTLSWLVRPAADRVSFRIAGPPCGRFAITAARLEGPGSAGLVEIFPDIDSTVIEIPPPWALPVMTEEMLRDQLRRDAEHLLRERLSDGRFSAHGAWYENSFPIRALLAAGERLEEPAWKEVAFAVLDDFVAHQRADGNWSSDYDDPRHCPGRIAASASANLADIGSMTLALAIATAKADEARRQRWLDALVTYADSISLPNQAPSGAFSNRRWKNHDYRFPYTVATATQVSTLAALHRLTGDPRYADAVARGTRWLAAQVREDGRIAFAPHDREAMTLIEATRFGDCYYAMEALAMVATWTEDEALRRDADAAFDRWVGGTSGLRASAREGYWWTMGDLWADSKMAGIPALLAKRSRRPSPPWLRSMVFQELGWLDDDRRARRIGVRASLASRRGDYALTATGFAGLSASAALLMQPDARGILE